MGLFNKLSCESGSFSCHHNPLRFLQPEVLRLSFPVLEPWVAQSILLPSCSSQFIHLQMWDHPLHQPSPCLVCQPSPFLPVPPATALLLVLSTQMPLSTPVWMKISSLTPWLSDFHAVQFSGSSCFLFLICCCPSSGSVRKQSVFTFASILARSASTFLMPLLSVFNLHLFL